MIILRFFTLFYLNFVISLSLNGFSYSSLSWSSIGDYIKDKSSTIYSNLPSWDSLSNLNWFEAKDDTVDKNSNFTQVQKLISQFNLLPIGEDLAKYWVNYAAIAYCPKSSIETWNCTLCKGEKQNIEYVFMYNESYNTSGFIMADKMQKAIIVSYKGSKNPVNWLMNLKSTYTKLNLTAPFENAKVHTGFYQMAGSLYPETKSNLERLISTYPEFNIVFTGHSMGGALATINAFALVIDGITTWNKISLITYGQPRVGNRDFVDYMDSQSTTIARVNREGDPVPTVPTPPLYYHHGYNMFIRKDDSTILCLPTDKGSNCTSSILEMTTKSHFSYWDFVLDSDCLN